MTWRTLSGRSAISAIPPALSVIGPYESIATTMPVMLSNAMAAMPMPYRPPSAADARMPIAMMSTGIAVPSMPIASPAMMLVACPVCDARAMVRTGQNCAPVKNSVTATMSTVMTMPITAHQKRLKTGWGSTPLSKP